jgi:hypothetical protein
MKYLFTIIFCLIASTVFGSPFLVCDAPPAAEGITHYKLTGWSIPQTPAPLHIGTTRFMIGTGQTMIISPTTGGCTVIIE